MVLTFVHNNGQIAILRGRWFVVHLSSLMWWTYYFLGVSDCFNLVYSIRSQSNNKRMDANFFAFQAILSTYGLLSTKEQLDSSHILVFMVYVYQR